MSLIHAHGSTSKVPYTSMGSGSLAARAILEEGWKEDMEEEDAKKLVRDAIAAGIINDMGSGSSIDIAVLKPNDQIDYIRPHEKLVVNVRATISILKVPLLFLVRKFTKLKMS